MATTSTDLADTFVQRISDWDALSSAVGHFSKFNGHDWLFRGVTDESRDLTPKVGRPRTKSSGTPKVTPYTFRDEKAVLDAFRQHARPYIADSHTPVEWM